MTFPLNLYLGALLGAFLASFATLPLWRAWCLRAGLVDDPGGRKIHDAPVPLAGGFAVMTGILAPLLGGALWLLAGAFTGGLPGLDESAVAKLDYGLAARRGQLAAILFGAVGMLLLGWLDDRQELKPLPKFAAQFALAALVAAAGVRVTLFVPSPAFSFLVTVLWIVTITNAVNFLDNMNGLCAGTGAIAAGFFALVAARQGQYLVAGIALLGCGALLGYVPWNFPRAAAFLGDAGSHVTGYLLAVLSILPSFYTSDHPSPVAVLGPLLILIVPLADLASVVWLRTRQGKPFWIGDTNHLSHRLVRAGLTRPQAVACLWLAGLLGGAAALAL